MSPDPQASRKAPAPPAPRRRVLGWSAASLAGLAAPRAFAQDKAYPVRPIRFVVPFAASAGADILARVYAKALADVAGQPVVVENRGGANGIVAVKAVLAAPADGYTVFFASNSALITNAAVVRNLPYDPVQDFAPVSILDGGYCVLVVPGNSRLRTMADLVAEAKRRPGALNHGAGSAQYALWNAWLNEIVGMRTQNIEYKGSGEAALAAASAQVDYSIVAVAPARPMLQAGRLRALMYTGDARAPTLPDVPTSAEAGAAGFNAFAWGAVAVRAGTPEPVIAELDRMFRQTAKHPEVLANLEAQGMQPMHTGPQKMRQFQVEEIVRLKRLAAATGLSIE